MWSNSVCDTSLSGKSADGMLPVDSVAFTYTQLVMGKSIRIDSRRWIEWLIFDSFNYGLTVNIEI